MMFQMSSEAISISFQRGIVLSRVVPSNDSFTGSLPTLRPATNKKSENDHSNTISKCSYISK